MTWFLFFFCCQWCHTIDTWGNHCALTSAQCSPLFYFFLIIIYFFIIFFELFVTATTSCVQLQPVTTFSKIMTYHNSSRPVAIGVVTSHDHSHDWTFGPDCFFWFRSKLDLNQKDQNIKIVLQHIRKLLCVQQKKTSHLRPNSDSSSLFYL